MKALPIGLLLLFPLTAWAEEIKQPRPMVMPPRFIATLPGAAPGNVTVTPVTPTSLRVEWSPTPGAVRYLIRRNGAADIAIDPNGGFLQAGRFAYTDVGRSPAMLHAYSVTAEYAAPTQPGSSAPVQVLTPLAVAPQNFKASVSGGNAVSLFWAPRAEASGYRIVRNGGNLPAVAFDAPGPSFVDRNLPPGQYTYVVSSIVRLANGETQFGLLSNPLTVRTRPLNIVAVGDSVMWGQGLSAPNKFVTKVALWLEGELRQRPFLNLKAHSGAITYPRPGGPVYENRSYDGEVPADWPTISHQISLASSASIAGQAPAGDVDLVLVDGCANNVSITAILNPFGDDGALRNDTRGYCEAGMTNVLREVVQKFPNAKVIVTGYYPIVSGQSDLRAMIPLFAILGVVLPPDPLVVGVGTTLGFRARAAARSDVFFNESNRSLQAAVDTVSSGQIRFARLNAGAENAYAAPNTWQWLIPTPPFVQDELYPHRKARCDEVLVAMRGNPDPGLHPLCLQASMGHPNALGAQAYVDAIRAAASPFLPEWRAVHLGPVAAPDDTLVVRVQPATLDANGGSLVATAFDGPSGTPLAGTVQFDNAAAGALGTQVRYSFQSSNGVGIVARLDIAGRQPRYFTIPVPAGTPVNLSLPKPGNRMAPRNQ